MIRIGYAPGAYDLFHVGRRQVPRLVSDQKKNSTARSGVSRREWISKLISPCNHRGTL